MTGIVNYGVGNIYSVVSAVKKCGEESFIIEKPSDFLKADKIILPGVGAFGKGIQHLQESGMKTALFDIIKTETIIKNMSKKIAILALLMVFILNICCKYLKCCF